MQETGYPYENDEVFKCFPEIEIRNKVISREYPFGQIIKGKDLEESKNTYKRCQGDGISTIFVPLKQLGYQ